MIEKKQLLCSFCGKNASDVKILIAGPTCYICNECVDLCSDIIQEGIWERRLRKRFAEEGLAIVPASILKTDPLVFSPRQTSLDKFNAFFGRPS